MLNINDFDLFIKENSTVSIENANRYADIGEKILQYAIEAENLVSFEEKMDEMIKTIPEFASTNPHNISNIACCFLYAQERDNFRLGQGYGKGSNINQYGDEKTSQKTIENLMEYFLKKREGKEYGYPRESTHDKWLDPAKAQYSEPKIGIDIATSPEHSIPSPLKGIHTVHFVYGKDESGVTKLLVKPENWGFKKPLHVLCHAWDWFTTTLLGISHEIKNLENRQETKLLREASVKKQYQELKQELRHNTSQIQDPKLQGLFKDIEQLIAPPWWQFWKKKEKGFDAPLATLNKLQDKLISWLNKNENHNDRSVVASFQSYTEEKMSELLAHKNFKYGSSFQKFSEVRLQYDEKGRPSLDRKGDYFKNKIADLKEDIQNKKEDIQNKNDFTYHHS